MASTRRKAPLCVPRSLQERPVARLLQQLLRKQVNRPPEYQRRNRLMRVTSICAPAMPVHVHRPVDIDRLDRVLVELWLVPQEAVTRADAMVTSGMRLGEALQEWRSQQGIALRRTQGSDTAQAHAPVLCGRGSSFAIYLDTHSFGEGDDLAIMRVDPRNPLFYPAIHSAYDLPASPRVVATIWGQEVSPGSRVAVVHRRHGYPSRTIHGGGPARRAG